MKILVGFPGSLVPQFARLSSRGLMRLAFSFLLLTVGTAVGFAADKRCYTCDPDYVAGSVVESGMTLGQLAEKSMDSLSKGDGDFESNLYGFCIEFPGDVKGARTLRRRLISQMEKLPVNGSIDLYFLEAGCNPGDIGRTLSPMAHLVAEYPVSRTPHLEVLRNYYLEKNKPEMFARILNAKNTEGHTSLDYVQYLLENGKYIPSQKVVLGEFIGYLCSHGAVYARYRSMSCETRRQ